MSNTPAWATSSDRGSESTNNNAINASTPPGSVANTTGGEPKNMAMARSALLFFNAGFSVMVAADGAVGIKNSDNGSDSGIVFIGLYLILFAAILFTYEIIQIYPCDQLDNIYKRNFGFLYGTIGKCAFILFIGVLSFGQSSVGNASAKSLAIATSVLVCIWGCVQIGLFFKYPEYFDKKVKYDPDQDFRS